MSSRARATPTWVAKNEWLIDAVSEFRALRPLVLLVTANFDESAVSDGTAGCHFKDEAFVYASNAVRGKLGPRLDTALQNIKVCNDVVAHIQEEHYQLSDKAQMSFNHVLIVLRGARDATDQSTLDMLADCIALRDGDDWTRTPFGKAIVVRNRRTVLYKDQKEATLQARLIDGAEKRHPATHAGYDGQLGEFILRSKRMKDHIPLSHFATMTLDSLHNSYNTSKITRFMITRILIKGSGTDATTFLEHAYSLYFRHVANGKLLHIEKPTVVEELEVGQIFECECKVFVDQVGEGLCARDAQVWLDYVKANPGELLLIYTFNHTAYADIDFTHDDTRKLLEEICGRPAAQFTRATADRLLRDFDFRGGATNPALIDLFAAATLVRVGFGTGIAKYIDTLIRNVAYLETPEAVGLNIHHIRTGTGQQVEENVAALIEAHKSCPVEGFGVRYVIAATLAIPIRVNKSFETAVEVAFTNKGGISVKDALNLAQIGDFKFVER